MLNEKFKERMKKLLGDEYTAFLCELEEKENVKALRVNRLKIEVDRFLADTPFDLEPLGYTDVGFIINNHEGIGQTPEHHSGMIYMQDPGAMATVCSLEVKKGAWVLDTCSAPGGKATQLAELVGEDGLVFCNEYVPKRAKTIVTNIERLGIKNAVVTSLDTAEFKKMFKGVFDVVVVDAPCSGEGMFRKSEEALTGWSEENVLASARRQKEILENVASLVKDGGYLLYSTCTYAKEENEDNALWFLKNHPNFTLEEVKGCVKSITANGIGDGQNDLEKARRFYPHISRGEGQFIALFKKKEEGEKPTILYKDATRPLGKEERTVVEKFFKEALVTPPDAKVVKYKDNIVLIRHGCPIPERNVFLSGVLLGEVKGANLFPSHQFFSAYGHLFRARENLKRGDERVLKYLRGEEIEATDKSQRGFCSVAYEDVSLGGGKISDGKIKNHYPKG